MSETYYAAVEGDPLTSGEGGQVYASGKTVTITDESGRPRRMVFIGDDAYCAKCESTGSITYGAGISDRKRMVDLVNGGRLQAVGGDIVLCKCRDHPRVMAIYGRRWTIHDRGDSNRITGRSNTSTTPAAAIYDQQFTLTDTSGNALANTYYTVRLSGGELVRGTTDAQGRTTRHMTDGPQRLAIYLGHREDFNSPCAE